MQTIIRGIQNKMQNCECKIFKVCGGCPERGKELTEYQKQKFAKINKILSVLPCSLPWSNPIFIPDGTRRRATMTFIYHKGYISLGFNQKSSNQIVDVDTCPLLTPMLNKVIPSLRELLKQLCAVSYKVRKGKKEVLQHIQSGDIWLCETTTGVDVVLEYNAPLTLEHRMIIFEFINSIHEIIRISHRCQSMNSSEPIIEKSKPYIKIGNKMVYIPAGTFLQPSQQGQDVLISLVNKYLGNTNGKIFDLFCGVGTFSYMLASDSSNHVVAVDSSLDLLQGFQESININKIPNIEVLTRNLFKYPMDVNELKGAKAIIFDPPRSGASAQVQVLSSIPIEDRPQKIIAVSCHPATFVNDAKVLLSGGYKLKEITFVDQFIYSNHSELVALFTT